MKTIKVEIKAGKVNLDFDGFVGKACSDEETIIRTLYQKMGVNTDVDSDNKREAEANGTAERERSGC